MSLPPSEVEKVAKFLEQAERGRLPIAPLAETFAGLDMESSYAIQLAGAQERLRRGEVLVGYKVGLTSLSAQKHFKIAEPDFGHLFTSMQVADGGDIELKSLIQAKVEGEIAFVLRRDLQGPGLSLREVTEAIAYAVPALEVIDSRIQDWRISALDTIADNGSSARFILGTKRAPIEGLSLEELGMAFSVDGEVAFTGSGAAVLGHPLKAVLFLANELGKHGVGLKAGQVILSGALSGMVPVRAGETYLCEVLHLGKVTGKGKGA